MRKIISVMLNDLRITFADQSIWIFLVVMPAILIFAVGFANGAGDTLAASANATTPPHRLVDVIDEDGSALAVQLVTVWRSIDPALLACPAADADSESAAACGLNEALTPALAAERLENGTTQALVIIPAGFADALLAAQPTSLIYRANDDPTAPSPTLAALQAAAQRISGAAVARQFAARLQAEGALSIAGFEEAVYERAAQYWAAEPIRIAVTTSTAREAVSVSTDPGFRQSVPGMGSMWVMFTVFAGATLLIQERKQWTLQRLITMPVTRGQYLAGKILARCVMGMIQFAVAFAVGILIGLAFGISYGHSPLALLIMMLTFTLCVSAMTLLIATLVQTEQQSAGITTLLALTLAPIGGAWWSLDFEFIPQFMKDIAVISPLYWVMDGFNAVILHGGGVADVLPAAGVLLALAAGMFALAIARFRVV